MIESSGPGSVHAAHAVDGDLLDEFLDDLDGAVGGVIRARDIRRGGVLDGGILGAVHVRRLTHRRSPPRGVGTTLGVAADGAARSDGGG